MISDCYCMMTSSNGNIFRVTGPLWGEFTGHRWIPLTKASDAELWCFLWSTPELTVEQTIEKLVIWDAIAFIMTSLEWSDYLLRHHCLLLSLSVSVSLCHMKTSVLSMLFNTDCHVVLPAIVYPANSDKHRGPGRILAGRRQLLQEVPLWRARNLDKQFQ